MAVNKTQETLYMNKRKSGHSQASAAAIAGISERTGRRIENRQLTRDEKPDSRIYRTRKDPLSEVWETTLVPMLEAQPGLLPMTLFEYLQDHYPGQFDKVQRTLQRRIKQWKAKHGPEREIMFRQVQQPGQQALVDFTKLKGVAIYIGDKLFDFILFHFRLAYSKWSYMRVIQGGESYTALTEGTAEALKRLGAVPKELRTDSLSAAYRNLSPSAQEDMTRRYQAFCQHYNMVGTRNNRGQSHENGAVESPHGHLKRRIIQQLKLAFPSVQDNAYRFESVQAWQRFIEGVFKRHNQRNEGLLREELAVMAALPVTRGVDYTQEYLRVSSSSTINLRRVIYSVPSQLIGERINVRLYDDRIECYVGSQWVETLERLYVKGNERGRRINYRHLIGNLSRKPMAFFHAELRDDILPNETWRRLWQQSCHQLAPRQACYLIVGALGLAAQGNEVQVAQVLQQVLTDHNEPSLLIVQKELGLTSTQLPQAEPKAEQHHLSAYDALLGGNHHE